MTRFDSKERILIGGYKPILNLYPRKLQGHTFRSFHKEWYKQYDRLEYSPTADAAFCFPCRIFKGNEKNCGQIDTAFFEKGFSAWYRAGEAFKKHQISKYHLNSSTALPNYLYNKSISSKLDELHPYQTSQKEIERQNNRLTMNRLIDIVICLVKGGIPFRGRDEKSQSVIYYIYLFTFLLVLQLCMCVLFYVYVFTFYRSINVSIFKFVGSY